MHMPKRGIVYVATGAAYIKEAIFSASITRKHTSNPIYLITDNPDYPDLVESCFSKIIQHPSPKYSYRDKISALVSLEFDYTLFLDTDVTNVSAIYISNTTTSPANSDNVNVLHHFTVCRLL